ncbi:hypothetical protein HYE68_007719 [Fusarium pseudograminearum]|nr:hypothetical protein HYE68_007719 [Fusarium pseudograminearum]
MTLSSSTLIPAKKDKLHTEACVARMKQMRLGEEMRLQLHSRASRSRATPQATTIFSSGFLIFVDRFTRTINDFNRLQPLRRLQCPAPV